MRGLCVRAARKDTQAIEELERDFPSLAQHVVTLVVDKDESTRRAACLKIAALGRDARGAAVLIEQAFDGVLLLPSDAGWQMAHDAADALVTLAPDAPGTMARVTKLAAMPSGQIQAVDRLGRIAEQSATTRPQVVELLAPLLESTDDVTREAAVKSLGACGDAAGKTLPKLRALKLDPADGVRKAVAATTGQIELHLKVAPELTRTGLDENAVGAELYAFAIDLAAATNPARSKQALQAAKPSATAVQTAVCLARLADADGLDRAAVRGLAFELLAAYAGTEALRPIMPPAIVGFLDANQPVSVRAGAATVAERLAVDRTLAPQLIPALVSAADVPQCSGAAIHGLALTGPDGARALRRQQSPAVAKLEALLIERFKSALAAGRDKPEEGAPAQVDALESLGALEVDSPETVKFLVMQTYPKIPGGRDRPDFVSRAAAKALSHLGPKHFPFATDIRERAVNTFGGDAETTAILTKVLKGMGLEDLSDLTYAVAVFSNPAATDHQRDRAPLDVIPRGNYEKLTEFLQQFARKADAKARRACCAEVWDDGSWIRASGDYGVQYARVLIRSFPEEAAEVVVPHIVEQLDIACTQKKGVPVRISPLSAIELLMENAPRNSAAVKSVLEKAVEFNHPRYDAAKVREKARAALDAYK